MKYSLLLFAAASVLTLGHPAQASTNREVDAYLQRASEAATAKIAAAGVEVPTGLKVKARVDSDGRLSAVRVVNSSGSWRPTRRRPRRCATSASPSRRWS